ncbi:MAG: c-type cytochrome [Vitreimonas sp.]
MRKILGCVAAVAALAACSQQPATPPAPTQAELVSRGQYLVNSIGGCNDCHTPMTLQGPDMAHALQGATIPFRLTAQLEGHIPWAPVSVPLAGGPAGYTDEQFVHFLMTGETAHGGPATPPMPQYRMNEEDARAVVAYIKTVPRAQ